MSVRPATVSSTGSRRTVASAASSSPCTVRRPGLPRPAAEAGAVVFDVEPDGGHRRQYPARPRHLESRSMRVLLTNDDGISAPGLQAARRALREIDGVEVDVIAPDSNRSATARSITTRSPLTRRGGRVRRRRRRLRDRRHAGRLRPLRRARPGRRPARPDRLRDQPRRQPRRRHHLLGHGRRRASRGSSSASRRSPSPSSPPAAAWATSAAASTSASPPPFTAELVAPPARRADARGDPDQRQLPRPASRPGSR